MSLRDNLQAASYKGVAFLVPVETETAGKKVQVHEFPGSDKRFVEELGEFLPTFRLTAVVHGRTADQQRLRLSGALKSKGPGVLVHPYLGRRDCTAVDWSIDTRQTSLGEIIFDITFVQTERPLSLKPVIGGVQAVFSTAERARAAIDEAFGERYLPVRITSTIRDLGARTRESIGIVQAAVSGASNPIADSLNALNSEVSQTRNSVFSVVRTPQQIVNGFRGAFNAALAVVQAPQDLAAEWLLVTEFGSSPRFLPSGQVSRPIGSIRAAIERTTGERATLDTNLRLIDQRVRVEALVNWMEAEAAREFRTVDELVETRSAIDAAFRRIVVDQTDALVAGGIGDTALTDANVIGVNDATLDAIALDESLVLDPDLRDTLADLKADVMAAISLSNKNPYVVEDIDIGISDIQIAAYEIFGSLDLLDDMKNLNSGENLASLSGQIRAISQ